MGESSVNRSLTTSQELSRARAIWQGCLVIPTMGEVIHVRQNDPEGKNVNMWKLNKQIKNSRSVLRVVSTRD